MAVAAELQSLLDALYDAAVDPTHWADFLNHLTRAVSGEAAALVLHDFANVSSSVAEQVGLSSEGTRLYAQHYYKLDVWTAKARESGKSIVTTTSEQLCPWSEFRRTEYYNDFLRIHGIAHGIFSMVRSSDCLFHLVERVQRPQGRIFGHRSRAYGIIKPPRAAGVSGAF